MADPTDDDKPHPTPREQQVADNLHVDASDPHESPANPENRIGIDRRAADDENREQILANAPEAIIGPTTPQRTRKTTARRVARNVVEVKSTGHSWDGIEEYDHPLPRWWLWTFYATIIWSVGYVLAYPAIPLINSATQGLLGHSVRSEVAGEIQRFEEANAPIATRLASVELEQIGQDPELLNYASNAGGAIFRTFCAQCHGSGAQGSSGYPNLLDNEWLWGGTMEEIHTTVLHGIRDPLDPDTRYSEMPRFGTDQMLDDQQIDQVVHHVLAISGNPHDAALAAEGEVIFVDNCSACHMEDGTGDQFQGAPDLTDAVWLYGADGQADPATIRRIVHDGPFGVMPSWTDRLTESEIRAVATYVHGLGGGE
ncbi:cytochrome-c oxidase, cbb3-type subunit III [Paracoccus sp. Z118]|nr:cytochrome-c oxidase, cbb3-type subunit III [Paracoccus sp. Z118]